MIFEIFDYFIKLNSFCFLHTYLKMKRDHRLANGNMEKEQKTSSTKCIYTGIIQGLHWYIREMKSDILRVCFLLMFKMHYICKLVDNKGHPY